MAMLGKRFQRTTSMSQIGPASSEKAQAHHRHQQQQEGELAEHHPANQWELLKNAEAMMMMMMAKSGANTSTKSSEDGPERQTMVMVAPGTKNEQHPQIGPYPCSPAPGLSPPEYLMSPPSTLIIPTHNFLDICFFCKRRLHPERDIFIYRGDAAFCTEECRHRHICDEKRSVLASKKGGATTSETAVAA